MLYIYIYLNYCGDSSSCFAQFEYLFLTINQYPTHLVEVMIMRHTVLPRLYHHNPPSIAVSQVSQETKSNYMSALSLVKTSVEHYGTLS